ncbi:hypothetical protein BAY61_19455 [Prauserella marina]|uniref:DNA-binding transcriptional regulator, AcrR family n=1 Tax=Prauserella marina TaxID=530584 RepID=A0A222VSW5_9PSEU|nr:hypothetical protein BAY61_19455 [Prauserella marina]PWV80281.1 TetR family transcriptional regulator [Prauserella marina]SDD50911.1 DNA-binding transcriptional regulator, AcrR family [Prauserella marina]
MPVQVKSRVRSDQHPRVRLQEAGTRLFYNNGFHATSVRDITEACGLTPGALYNHFGSKEQLLHAIIMDGHAVLGREFAAVSEEQPPVPQLRALIEVFVLHHTRFRKEAMVGDAWRALDETHRNEVRELRLGIRGRVREVIQAGLASGVFTVPSVPGGDAAQFAATAALDMGFRVSSWFDPDGPVSDAAFASFYAEFVLRAVTHAG